jgi:signal transduction histidine kinase
MARKEAATARGRLVFAILACIAIIGLFLGLTQRWIAEPLKRLTASAEDIRDGNLDLVLDIPTSDEIGRLARAFNDMAEALRRSRREGQRDLIRSQRAAEEVLKALPAAIALVNPEGRVEAATETAQKHFGLVPGACVRDLGQEWLTKLFDQALGRGQAIFRGREYFFQPSAHPIPAAMHGGDPAGVAVILKDMTEERQQAELKRSVLATVSHQLKTPLTSLRMSIHLLLDEALGPMSAKQTELALAAREESERLTSILEDLLDLDRMEGGRAYLNMEPAAPCELAEQGIAPWLSEGKAKGVTIINEVPEDLPPVLADPARIAHVFSNLLSNAFRFTGPGGSIVIQGKAEEGAVRIEVRDTGSGVPPSAVGRVFDRFYRAPGQEPSTGAGLGLAIVREIVEAHGGTVGLEPAPDRGSVFWFTLLPAADVPPGTETKGKA